MRRATGYLIDKQMEVCEMQNAETVLSILKQKSENDEQYVFDRIYRNLFNEEFYIRAYKKIYAKQGNMTQGIDGKTIDGFKKQTIVDVIELLKFEQYYPQPVRRTYIPKKNGKMRPLGIPTFTDKLIQEVIRQLLEAIYEPIFCDSSHGFRPNKSCHTALYQIKSKCRGTNWIIEGDITACFDNIDHDVLIRILSKKIKDGRLLELIRRFLKAGYLEFEKMHNSFSGTPQGGIISPILANIYLHEFDKYMEELCKKFSKGKQKKVNPEYHRLNCKRWKANKNGDYEKANQILKEMQTINALDPMDSNFIRINYTRYADDFLVCIIGSKALAVEIKNKIAFFMENELKLELSQEKTMITNLSHQRVKFLGYEVSKTHENTKQVIDSIGRKKRSANGTIQLLVPSKAINKKLETFRKHGVSYPFVAKVNLPVLDIINSYNAEIRGLYNYYCLATDVSKKIATFKYYHYYSMIKTIARKEKSSVKKVFNKYGISVPRKIGTGTLHIIGMKYKTKNGEKTITYFNDSLKKIDKPMTKINDIFGQNFIGGQLIKRINANQCELCGADTSELEVHHIRKLKDITRKYKKRGTAIPNWVMLMSTIKRKTLVVCHKCHVNIHTGKY